MKAATRLLCSLGLFLAVAVDSNAAAGTVRTIGGSFTPGYRDGNNQVSLFNQPNGLAVDSLGRVLVADFANNAVRFITVADEVTGTFTRNVNGPIAVAALGDDVLVVNYNSGTVSRFNRDGVFQSLFASNLANPTAIAVDSAGNVFIAAQAGGVRRYTTAGVFVQSYSTSEGTPNFRGIAVSPDNTFVVADAGNHVIWKFPIGGGAGSIFAGTMGSAGFAEGAVGVGKLNAPHHVARGLNGIMVVADRFNHRVRAVDVNGVLSTLYGVDPATWLGAPSETLPGWADGPADEAELREPVGVAVDNSGNVFDSEVFYSVIRKVTSLTYPTNTPGGSTGPSGANKNMISLGFAGRVEASSDFVGAPGQRFIAPITLTLIPGTTIYGMQFNVTIDPANASTMNAPYNPQFQSHLMKPVIGMANVFTRIKPEAYVRTDFTVVERIVEVNGQLSLVQFTNYNPVFTPLVITGGTFGNLLGVGWLERRTQTNLYDTISQDLIRFSMAHDYMYDGRLGRVVVGAASFRIPSTTPISSQYLIKINRPSANSDGVAQDVVIETPDGTDVSQPLTATRVLNMGVRKYLVGDVAPFRWFNAGDFGDNSILNNDLEQLHQTFAYGFNSPPPESDMLDALDSCCSDINGVDIGTSPSNYQFATPATLNIIARGDGALTLEDLYVTFRRALDPSLTNYYRFWSGGSLRAEATTNSFRGVAGDKATYVYKKPVLDTARLEEPTTATFKAGDLKASPGQTVRVPVDLAITGPLAAKSLRLVVTVAGLDGAPPPDIDVNFSPSTTVGLPTSSAVTQGLTYSAIWFELQNGLAAGIHRIGTVDFVIPSTANADSLYFVKIEKAEASTQLARFPVTTTSGIVLMNNRAAAPWTDEIPDDWRVQYFGSLMNILSAPDADADGDGVSNLDEYRTGTNPTDISSAFKLNTSKGASTVALKWPSVAGKTYRLESAPTLTGGVWTVVEDGISGTGGTIERNASLEGGQARFFRVHIVQ